MQPGATWPYTWFLPETSGPGPGDPSAIPWLYHGHVHEAGDENTGLVGVLLVTARGAAALSAFTFATPSSVKKDEKAMGGRLARERSGGVSVVGRRRGRGGARATRAHLARSTGTALRK